MLDSCVPTPGSATIRTHSVSRGPCVKGWVHSVVLGGHLGCALHGDRHGGTLFFSVLSQHEFRSFLSYLFMVSQHRSKATRHPIMDLSGFGQKKLLYRWIISGFDTVIMSHLYC